MTLSTPRVVASSEGVRSRTSDQGLLTTELAILMPVMLLIALVAVFAVHVERQGSRVQQAADAAARAASHTRTEADAIIAAQAAAEAVCEGSVAIQLPISFVPPDVGTFTPGRVRVQLACTEAFNGFRPLIADSSRTDYGVGVAVIEYWRPEA